MNEYNQAIYEIAETIIDCDADINEVAEYLNEEYPEILEDVLLCVDEIGDTQKGQEKIRSFAKNKREWNTRNVYHANYVTGDPHSTDGEKYRRGQLAKMEAQKHPEAANYKKYLDDRKKEDVKRHIRESIRHNQDESTAKKLEDYADKRARQHKELHGYHYAQKMSRESGKDTERPRPEWDRKNKATDSGTAIVSGRRKKTEFSKKINDPKALAKDHKSTNEGGSPVVESTAKNILSRTVGRREFGKYVNECMLGWDGDKLVVGTYDGYDSIDYWNDKAGVQRFTEEAAQFCNDLNSKLHIKDYHFNMVETGMLEGQIYISRDQDYFDQVVDSDNKLDDHNYISEGAYMAYLTNKAVLQNKTKRMVKEALILTDDSIPVNEAVDQLMALNESGIGDAWTKFKNFFEKMWAKFTEFFNRMIVADKTYLDKYKDIILNKEFNLPNVKIAGDYAKGVQNISQYQVYQINAADIKSMTGTDDASYEGYIQPKLMPAYQGSVGKTDFAAFCKSYFKGGDNEVEYTGSNPTLSDMYNLCYNFDKIKNSIEKDKKDMYNAGTVFENEIKGQDQVNPTGGTKQPVDTTNMNPEQKKYQDAVNAARTAKEKAVKALADEKERTKDQNPKPSYANLEKAVSDADSNLRTAEANLNTYLSKSAATKNNLGKPKGANESVVHTSIGTYVLEDNGGVSLNGTSSGNNNVSTGNVSDVKKFGNQGGTGATAIRQKAGQGGSTIATNDETAQKELLAKAGAYTRTATTIFSSMLTAAETIEKGYMTIIKAHVQSYLGKTDTTNNTMTQASTNNAINANVWDNEDTIRAYLSDIQQIKNANGGQITVKDAQGKDMQIDSTTHANNLLNKAAQDSGSTNNVPNRTFANIGELETELNNRLRTIENQKTQQQNQQQAAPTT